MRVKNGVRLLIFIVLMACSNTKESQPRLDIGKMIQPTPRYSVLEHDDYWVWGGSMVRTEDGICHMFYSRWPKSGPFSNWIFDSEIAYATTNNPGGPYTFQKVVLNGRGTDHWDKDMAHNPHIKKFGNKYYLYFVSHNVKDLGLGHRSNHTFSQCIGVAVADSPVGPWKICEQPVVEVQEGKAAHGYVTNPSVCQRPDGTFQMILKSRPENWREIEGFTSIHCIATAPTPEGPFTIAEKPILTEATAEDPFMWFSDGKYYAIVDDQYGDYIGTKGLALFESKDGINWNASDNPMVSKVQILWEDQTITQLKHLERPQLWFDENGVPAILFCAAQVLDENGELNSFNVHIPLKLQQ
ncbi:MAG: glycoside hydrolase family protein [Draconibacterium sp.]